MQTSNRHISIEVRYVLRDFTDSRIRRAPKKMDGSGPNPGQHRALTDGVCELKIDFGPGYRVYYTERAGVVVVLLAGGDKSTQQKDIKTAITLAKGL